MMISHEGRGSCAELRQTKVGRQLHPWLYECRKRPLTLIDIAFKQTEGITRGESSNQGDRESTVGSGNGLDFSGVPAVYLNVRFSCDHISERCSLCWSFYILPIWSTCSSPRLSTDSAVSTSSRKADVMLAIPNSWPAPDRFEFWRHRRVPAGFFKAATCTQ